MCVCARVCVLGLKWKGATKLPAALQFHFGFLMVGLGGGGRSMEMCNVLKGGGVTAISPAIPFLVILWTPIDDTMSAI